MKLRNQTRWWITAGSALCLVACGANPASSADGADAPEAAEDRVGAPDVSVSDVFVSREPDSSAAWVDASVGEHDAAVVCADTASGIVSEEMKRHLESLEAIGDSHDGERAAGTPGWHASVAYVTQQLVTFGYDVTMHPAEYPFFQTHAHPVLATTTPSPTLYQYSSGADTTADFQDVRFSPPGDVTAPLGVIDVSLGVGNDSTSGCTPADYASFPVDRVALVQAGGCPLLKKVRNAQAAGARAVVIFNQGDSGERLGLIPEGVVLAGHRPDHGARIPVVFASYGVGAELAASVAAGDDVTMRVVVDTTYDVRVTHSLLAETRSGDPEDVVMLGAHLDSGSAGPGINDNGSGVAALLEIARNIAGCDVTRRVRFAWWGAGEVGQWGSTAYVFGLSDADRSRIRMYLNADVLASRNHVNLIYDGDGSDYGVAGAAGSGEIEHFFQSDFLLAGLPSRATFVNRSDHVPFLIANIPHGGLSSGARGLKTEAEAAVFGGMAGQPYDACHDAACDTMANVELGVLQTMVESLARAVQFFGVDGRSVVPAP